MNAVQAAVKAFRNCRKNHEKSRSVASYLVRQYLIGNGVKPSEIDEQMPEANRLLDEWFASRTANPEFVPSLPKIETGKVEPTDQLETSIVDEG